MFFYITLSAYLFAHLYIFFALLRYFGRRIWLWPVLLWFTAMTGTWFFRHGEGGKWFEGVMVFCFAWLGFVIITSVVLAGLDVFALIVRRLGGRHTYRFDARFTVPFGLCLGLCLSLYAGWEAWNIQPHYVRLPVASLAPGAKPVRLAVLSDVHLGRINGPRMLERVAAAVREAKPDILLSLGDLVDGNMAERGKDAEILRGMTPPGGFYGVMGNHEFYRDENNSVAFHERAGIRLLRQEAVEVLGLCLAGVDDENAEDLSLHTTDPVAALKQCPQGMPAVLLQHRPPAAPEAAALFSLQLSGHTHGGQIWPVPYLYSFWRPLEPTYLSEVPAAGGGKSLRYLTPGTGFWGPPMRFLTPPEVTVIDLVPAETP